MGKRALDDEGAGELRYIPGKRKLATMSDSKSKPVLRKSALKWIIPALVVALLAVIVFRLWSVKHNSLPKGIVSGNGRIEAQLVDVAAKEPLRVEKIFVSEGDLVKQGQILLELNTSTLQAELAEAKAKVSSAKKQVATAQASVQRFRSELNLAQIEARRSKNLFESNAGSKSEYDQNRTRVNSGTAALAEATAKFQEAQDEVDAALASVATIQTRISDATLTSPVLGRVLYRLTEPGEVLSPGGKALTLVDLSDVYMEIFLPSNQAAALKMGSEGRISLDYLPDWTIPARVSFVSPEAQFTPKQVETKSERELLMFRVKLQVPQELVLRYVKQIKTGVRGIGYVKVDPSAVWPENLQKLLPAE
jgi:HlyD family secretion protein